MNPNLTTKTLTLLTPKKLKQLKENEDEDVHEIRRQMVKRTTKKFTTTKNLVIGNQIEKVKEDQKKFSIKSNLSEGHHKKLLDKINTPTKTPSRFKKIDIQEDNNETFNI